MTTSNMTMTLKEIADISGVSIATVSRVLSNSAGVSLRTKNKVLAAMRGEGGSGMKSGLVALLVPDSANIFFSQLLRGIESIARIHEYTIIVCHTENSAAYEEETLKKMLSIAVEGLIYIGAGPVSATLRRIIDEKSIPLVFLDRDLGVADCTLITADNTDGMYQAATYLLSLGHERILYIEGSADISVTMKRRAGFEKALNRAAQRSPEVDYVPGDYTFETAYRTISDMIDAGRFCFTAICAANDMMALGACHALREHGKGIPEDVSVIGYDNIPTALMLNLTTVRQPYEEMGRTAMLALITHIQNPLSPPLSNMLSTSLVIRNSCRSVGL